MKLLAKHRKELEASKIHPHVIDLNFESLQRQSNHQTSQNSLRNYTNQNTLVYCLQLTCLCPLPLSRFQHQLPRINLQYSKTTLNTQHTCQI